MALNFPNSPTLNQIYTDSTSGFSYQWNGTVWISFSASTANNISELDNISGSFNNSTTIFPLTVGGQPVSPVTTNQLLISVGGVMQNPTDDYSVSGSNIVFTTAPTNGLTFFGTLLGTALPLNTIADGSVTPVKLSTGGPLWNTSGGVYISGITTITNASGTVTIGIGTTALLVEGNARVTGILTVGSSSITLNGITDTINVGTGLTLSSSGINVTGVITATSFVGNGSGLTGAGSTVFNNTTTNQEFFPLFTATTSGTITASGISTSKLTYNPSTGNVTATSFVGSLTGTASTATAAATAYGLTGSPNITVGIITATTLTAGNVTISSGIVTATSGVTTYFGDGSKLSGISASGTLLRAPQVLTSGTSYTTPAGCTAVYVECVGGGGAGGGTGSDESSGSGGGGGGAGGYCAKYFTVSPSTSYTYAIGSGGSGTSNAPGNTGGSTTFTVSATTITASGGGGGGSTGTGSLAGTGGNASGGDINATGSGGQGATNSGVNASRWGGSGGSSFFGGAGRGPSYGDSPTAGGNGSAGGGGGGAVSYSGGGSRAGGNGGNGLIRIWEYS